MSVEILVEVSRGTPNKYEIDEKTGKKKVDRVLHGSAHYFFNYGSVPGTIGGDDDAVDAVIWCDNSFDSGSYIDCRPIAVLETFDEKGADDKVIFVPNDSTDPCFSEKTNLSHISKGWRLKFEDFFSTYKALEPGKKSVVGEFKDVDQAWAKIEEGRERYRRWEEEERLKNPPLEDRVIALQTQVHELQSQMSKLMHLLARQPMQVQKSTPMTDADFTELKERHHR